MLPKKTTFSLLITLFIVGCSGNCPAIKKYSIKDQEIIAHERNSLSNNDPLKSFVDEGERLRRYCR